TVRPPEADREQHTGAAPPMRTGRAPPAHEERHRPRDARGQWDGRPSGPPHEGRTTVADSSFDIVSKLDRQEIDNAVNQAVKEVRQRYDFRNTGASLTLSGDEIVMTANAEERVLAVLDVLQSKLVRRGVSLKALDVGDPKQSGKEMRVVASLTEAIGASPGTWVSARSTTGECVPAGRRPAGADARACGRAPHPEQLRRPPHTEPGTRTSALVRPGVLLLGVMLAPLALLRETV